MPTAHGGRFVMPSGEFCQSVGTMLADLNISYCRCQFLILTFKTPLTPNRGSLLSQKGLRYLLSFIPGTYTYFDTRFMLSTFN